MSKIEYNELNKIECYKRDRSKKGSKTGWKQGRSMGVALSRVFNVSLSYASISSYNGLLPWSSQLFSDLRFPGSIFFLRRSWASFVVAWPKPFVPNYLTNQYWVQQCIYDLLVHFEVKMLETGDINTCKFIIYEKESKREK